MSYLCLIIQNSCCFQGPRGSRTETLLPCLDVHSRQTRYEQLYVFDGSNYCLLAMQALYYSLKICRIAFSQMYHSQEAQILFVNDCVCPLVYSEQPCLHSRNWHDRLFDDVARMFAGHFSPRSIASAAFFIDGTIPCRFRRGLILRSSWILQKTPAFC